MYSRNSKLWSRNTKSLSGCSGLAVGGIVGLARMPTPGLFAVASGFQCFALGSTFWGTCHLYILKHGVFMLYHVGGKTCSLILFPFLVLHVILRFIVLTLSVISTLLTITSVATRSAFLHYRYHDSSTPKDRLQVSTFAGGLTGSIIGGLISTYHHP